MVRSCIGVALAVSACGNDAPPTDITCQPQLVYLNRSGGTFVAGARDDATTNTSTLVDAERVLAPWPYDEIDWRSLVDCVTTALLPLPRLVVTEQDPGTVPHVELVFTTSYWAGSIGTTMIVPGGCRSGHQIGFVFGDALPTYARACHVAMQGFAQMTALLSLDDNCRDFLNNALDCAPERTFVDAEATCVDASNQPAACRCGDATTQNTYAALAARFPPCP